MCHSACFHLFFSPSVLVQLSDFRLMTLGANYPRTFVTFGHPQAKGTYNSYLLKDIETGSYEIWATSQWNHFCLSYQRDGTIRTVKVDHIRTVSTVLYIEIFQYILL